MARKTSEGLGLLGLLLLSGVMLGFFVVGVYGVFFASGALSSPRARLAQKVDPARLSLRAADETLSRAKELGEQARILLGRAETALWAARLSEADRNVCVSWYGKPYHGRLAASGVRFDMNDRHVAHRWLPFGTKVMFYNPLNGEVSHGVVVDRGPFIDGRIFDVSYFMAEELGMVEQGIAIVRCWVPELPGELDVGMPLGRWRGRLRDASLAAIVGGLVLRPSMGD
jgi:hypothetical protein